MFIESQMLWRAQLTLVSKFSSLLLPVPPFDRSTGLPYPPKLILDEDRWYMTKCDRVRRWGCNGGIGMLQVILGV
jgi:hypothetical protein